MLFSNIVGDNLFQDENLSLLEQHDDLRIISAKILGREISQITGSSSNLKSTIQEVLISQMHKFKPNEIDELFEANPKNDFHIVKLKLIKELSEEIY